jgi:uncharacterized caspase-like protein
MATERHDARAIDDYDAAIKADPGSRANQAMAKVQLSLLSGPAIPRPRTPPEAAPPPGTADAASPAATTATGRRVALVVGNGAYAHIEALRNPPNDAHAIANSLRHIGFTVYEGIDLDRAKMQSKIGDFLREAVRSQIAVVYYAGHGVQIDGCNYLVPIDFRVQVGRRRMTHAMVQVDAIMAGLDDQLRTNIIILDACRNNPMAPQAVSAGPNRGIEAGSGLVAPASLGTGSPLGAGTLIAFATAPGQVAFDGEGDNSPFSAALSHHIGTPGLEVQQMLTRVRDEVVAATKFRQVPWSNSSLLGEVYLAGELTVPAGNVVPGRIEGANPESRVCGFDA